MTNVTLKDIANELGISVNSVSHALRDLPDISAETKELVRRKAEELGYISNSLATNLKNGSTNLIGVVYDNLGNPYFSIVCSKLFKSLLAKGYSTLVVPSSRNHLSLSEYLALASKRVNAVISFLEPEKEIVSSPVIKRVPIILVGRQDKNNLCDCVYTDDREGGRLAAKRLLSFKPDKIGYVGPNTIENAGRRFLGFEEAAKKAGVPIIKYFINDDMESPEIAKAILRDGCHHVFAFNDILANAMINTIKSMDPTYGESLVIVGYDNIRSECPYFPDIDSIAYNYDQEVDIAVKYALKGVSTKSETEKECIELPVSLHIRN